VCLNSRLSATINLEYILLSKIYYITELEAVQEENEMVLVLVEVAEEGEE
jgi:hypothetical protein